MKTCPSCGKGIGENTNFCPFCGAQCAQDVNPESQDASEGQEVVYSTESASPDVVKTANGMSIAGLVLGLIAIVLAFIPGIGFLGWICGVVGIILSAVAISQCKKIGQKSSLAVAGLVLSIISVVIGLIVALIACVAGCAIAGTAGLL